MFNIGLEGMVSLDNEAGNISLSGKLIGIASVSQCGGIDNHIVVLRLQDLHQLG